MGRPDIRTLQRRFPLKIFFIRLFGEIHEQFLRLNTQGGYPKEWV